MEDKVLNPFYWYWRHIYNCMYILRFFNTQYLSESWHLVSYYSLYLGILYDQKPSNNNFCLVGFCEYSFLGSRNWRIIIIPKRKLPVYTCIECHFHSMSFRLRWDKHFFLSIYVFISIALLCINIKLCSLMHSQPFENVLYFRKYWC